MSKQPWWQSDNYVEPAPVPEAFDRTAGPEGIALVRAWPSGVTDKGWGLNPPPGSNEGFMPRYNRGEFAPRRTVFGFDKGKWAFAFIMRSTRLVCIDIDGKNGGFDHVRKLGALPPTLAETSKSGDGYHLFYAVDEPWDPTTGYGRMSDRIGIEQGVDFRATGCVYHHEQQRWNLREVAMLPAHLYDSLTARDQKVAASNARITSVMEGDDDMEKLMLHDELVSELGKDIPAGKRNNTLFAIGSQMATAGVDAWQDKVKDRATELGLGNDEADKLVSNIDRYAPVATP